MKSKNLKNVVYLFLALSFSVAVSGGCGGGGGHYSGNYGDSSDSSQEVTIENVSTDVVPPEPEEPTLSEQFASENGDDDYAAREVNAFMLLNNTTWSIDQIALYTSNGTLCNIKRSSPYYDMRSGRTYDNKTKITFLITGSNRMAWATPGTKTNPSSYDLAVQFPSLEDNRIVSFAPMVRTANFVELEKNTVYQANVAKNYQIGAGTESIYVLDNLNKNYLVANNIQVRNQFMDSDKQYTCIISLSRVDNFSILDQTEWQFKNIKVFGLIQNSNGEYVCGDPKNYPVLTSYKNAKLTLSTPVNNGAKFLSFKLNDEQNFDDNGRLSVKFRDNYLKKDFEATILNSVSSGSGFKSQGKQNDFEVFEAKALSLALPDQFRNDHLVQQQLYVSDYGPNANIEIRYTSYCYDKDSNVYRFYWSICDLVPYIPNK